MVELEIKILKYIKEHKDAVCLDVVNNLAHPDSYKTVENVIASLLDEGLIKSSGGNDLLSSHLSFTPIGTVKFLYEIEAIEKSKKEDRRYRITTGIALLGAITGIIALIWNILGYLTQL